MIQNPAVVLWREVMRLPVSVHRGIHLIVLDNISDPGGVIGAEQLEWLRTALDHLDRDIPIVVLTTST